MALERYLKVTKNRSTYTVSGYVNKILVWSENEILLKSVLAYGIKEEQLPQIVGETKKFEVKENWDEI